MAKRKAPVKKPQPSEPKKPPVQPAPVPDEPPRMIRRDEITNKARALGKSALVVFAVSLGGRIDCEAVGTNEEGEEIAAKLKFHLETEFEEIMKRVQVPGQ